MAGIQRPSAGREHGGVPSASQRLRRPRCLHGWRAREERPAVCSRSIRARSKRKSSGWSRSVRRSVSDLELAKANRARAERLISAHAISREEYERQVAAEASAQGALGSIDASLQEARLNREFTEVRAPIDGHVSRAIITAGNLVTSASLLTTLVSDDPVYVYFDADEQTYLRYAKAKRDHAHASTGASDVYIGLVDEDGYPHPGQLDFIDNQVDATTGTIRARAALANPDGRYTPGLFARVRLIGGEDRDSVLIEDRAVGTDLSKKFVLTLTKDNRIEYRLVELGPEINGLRVVTQGLAPNEIIVVNGLQHVRPGQTVAATRVAMSDAAGGLTQVAANPSVQPASAASASSPADAVSRLAQATLALHVVR